ncbi:flagellar hook assembly protein FlgD [Sphingomonas sp. Leaf62]|uniref:flagellar hook assembly protein FlgD n=1 Tax=Sphingomonas sp. Leaf62 TaxID=1736228 RepID=UPI00070153C1|nr:flagellar hook capping FlgD N-terminal domain-containing protein [Sphingomonas sp. Leaf62]KQN71170.1 flagellar hook capping protein [Sphingomonas sp. Leaf62]
MQTAPVSSVTPGGEQSPTQSATSAFGLGFDALLKIILTQLTYQDPLKPMDNFQFVSQLAQFSQVQQGQTANERLQALTAMQATNQATGLLGKRVDIAAGSATLTGLVTAIALSGGSPSITIETDDKRTIAGVAIGNIVQIREKN